MKYTVDAGDIPGRVILDGKRIYACQEVDVDRGEVKAPLINKECWPIFDFTTDDYVIVKRRGRIEFEEFSKEFVPLGQADLEGNPFLVETEPVPDGHDWRSTK